MGTKTGTKPAPLLEEKLTRQAFYILNRTDRLKKSTKNFYVRYPQKDGTQIKKSIDSLYSLLTGEEKHIGSKTEAYSIAQAALDKDLIKQEKKGLLIPYVQQFWDYDNSPYRKECDYSGKNLGKPHFDNMLRAFNTYCLPLIPPTLVYSGMTLSLLEDIKTGLREKKVSASTYNKALGSIRQPLQYLYEKGKISVNFADRIKNITQRNKKDKGIFETKEEAERYISYLKNTYLSGTFERWRYLIPALGYYSGMREGEIRALKKEDITLRKDKDMSIIHVTHSYNDDEAEGKRYKCTKGKEERYTFAPTPLIEEVLNFLDFSPYPEGYIFASIVKPEVPIGKKTISEYFNIDLCSSLGITEEQRADRNITFHSLRHEFNTNLVNSGMKGEHIRSMTGHKSQSMTDHYTHTTEEGLDSIAEAVEKALPYIK